MVRLRFQTDLFTFFTRGLKKWVIDMMVFIIYTVLLHVVVKCKGCPIKCLILVSSHCYSIWSKQGLDNGRKKNGCRRFFSNEKFCKMHRILNRSLHITGMILHHHPSRKISKKIMQSPKKPELWLKQGRPR